MKLPKLTAANQAVLVEQRNRIAAALAALGGRDTKSQKHADLAERLTKEIARLEDEADPSDGKAETELAGKRAQLSLANRRLEQAQGEEQNFDRGGKLRGVVSELEETLRVIMLPIYEQHLAEIAVALLPFYIDEASARRAARSTDLINAWGGFFSTVSTCCTLAGKGEVERLLQYLDLILEGRLPFNFQTSAATPAAD